MRNVKKEQEWLNANYKRYEIRVKKEIATKFTELLKKQGKSVNAWGNEQIEKYLKNFSKKT